MREILHRLQRLWRGEEGASTTEYALLLALVVIILIGSLSQLGQALKGKLSEIIQSIQSAAGP
ncbi:MAG: Flp family type IVb pilin [Bacillota bacterium]